MSLLQVRPRPHPVGWNTAAVFFFHLALVSSLSSDYRRSSSSMASSQSVPPSSQPWAPADWQLTLEIGRVKKSKEAMAAAAGLVVTDEVPEDWAKSGAKLALSLDVLVDPDSCPGDAEGPIGRNANKLIPQTDASFVNNLGQQNVKFGDGGWRITSVGTDTSKTKMGHASTLKWWLDIESEDGTDGSDFYRNDVSLPRTCRLIGCAPCWREPSLESGRRRLRPLLQDFKSKQADVDEQVSHESGDRRLDGTDLKETIVAFKDMAVLVQKRDDAKRKLKDAEAYLPKDRPYAVGPWPGTTERLAIGEGVLTMVTQSSKAGNPLSVFGAQEVRIIGSWKAIPVEYEEYFEDDEEEMAEKGSER